MDKPVYFGQLRKRCAERRRHDRYPGACLHQQSRFRRRSFIAACHQAVFAAKIHEYR